MTNTANEIKYFQIIGGDTVLQLDNNGWTRWDFQDGIVSTNVAWVENSPELKRITKDEAISLMK